MGNPSLEDVVAAAGAEGSVLAESVEENRPEDVGGEEDGVMGEIVVEEPVVKVHIAVNGAAGEEPVVEVPVVTAAAAEEGVEEIAAVLVIADEGSVVRDKVEGVVEVAYGAEKIRAVSKAVGEVSEEAIGVDIPEGKVKLRTAEVGVTGSDKNIKEIIAGEEKDEMLAGGKLGKEPVAYVDVVEKIDAVSDLLLMRGSRLPE